MEDKIDKLGFIKTKKKKKSSAFKKTTLRK